MKVGIFSPYKTVTPHFETELELAQLHLDAGDKVEFISCSGELACCDFNLTRVESDCHTCRGRRDSGLVMLNGPATRVPFQSETYDFPEFKTVEQLVDFRIDNFDLGYAALSSIVSVLRDPEPDLELHREMLVRFLLAGYAAYTTTLDYIRNSTPDRIYLFNGRFAAMRGVLRACELTGIDCVIHERGCDNDHYELFKNHLPHNIEATEKTIRESWALADKTSRSGIAESWFHDRVNRVERNWKSFVKDQKSGRLPSNFNAAIRNVSIFCSSDDEFVAIGDCWTNHLYENQVVAVRAIAQSMLETSPDTHLYLRVHPNLKDVENQRKEEMLSLDFPNLTIIEPESTVDSYALVRASTTVVSFGSSVGIEAVFHDKPSVLLGPCFYRNLGGVELPDSHDKVISLLTTELQTQDKTGALMYGYWLQTRGIKYRFYKATGLFEGKFKGELIYDRSHEEGRPSSVAGKLKRETKRILARFR